MIVATQRLRRCRRLTIGRLCFFLRIHRLVAPKAQEGFSTSPRNQRNNHQHNDKNNKNSDRDGLSSSSPSLSVEVLQQQQQQQQQSQTEGNDKEEESNHFRLYKKSENLQLALTTIAMCPSGHSKVASVLASSSSSSSTAISSRQARSIRRRRQYYHEIPPRSPTRCIILHSSSNDKSCRCSSLQSRRRRDRDMGSGSHGLSVPDETLTNELVVNDGDDVARLEHHPMGMVASCGDSPHLLVSVQRSIPGIRCYNHWLVGADIPFPTQQREPLKTIQKVQPQDDYKTRTQTLVVVDRVSVAGSHINDLMIPPYKDMNNDGVVGDELLTNTDVKQGQPNGTSVQVVDQEEPFATCDATHHEKENVQIAGSREGKELEHDEDNRGVTATTTTTTAIPRENIECVDQEEPFATCDATHHEKVNVQIAGSREGKELERDEDNRGVTATTTTTAIPRENIECPNTQKPLKALHEMISINEKDDVDEDSYFKSDDNSERGGKDTLSQPQQEQHNGDLDIAVYMQKETGINLDPARYLDLASRLLELQDQQEERIERGEVAAIRLTCQQSALDSLLPFQRQAFDVSRNKAQNLHKSVLVALQKRVCLLGFSSPMTTLQKCLDYIRDDAPIIIHLTKRTLYKLVKSTEYRNFVQRSTTRKPKLVSARNAWEHRMYGTCYGKDCPSWDRPKYGCLNLMGDPAGVARARRSHGDLYLILQPHVRYRATFFSRELHKGVAAATAAEASYRIPATNEYYAHMLYEYSDLDLKAALTVSTEPPMRVQGKDSTGSLYVQVQIHGRIDLLGDIQALVVPGKESKADMTLLRNVKRFQEKTSCNILWQGYLTLEKRKIPDETS